MKTLVILTVLSVGVLTWAASVPPDLQNQNKDSLANIIVPEDARSADNAVGFKKTKEVDLGDLLLNDKENEEDDVFWRPWNGKIPKDAVVGAYGQTDCGANVPIYMAQAFGKSSSHFGIFPAQIFQKSKAVTVSFAGKEFKCKDNIKILCAGNPSILTWVPIEKTKDLNLIATKDCVIAGNELTFNLYFGRTVYEDETIIGKAVYHTNTMYFPYYGEEEFISEKYEILCYRAAIEARKAEAAAREAVKKRVESEKAEPPQGEKERLESEKAAASEEEKERLRAELSEEIKAFYVELKEGFAKMRLKIKAFSK